MGTLFFLYKNLFSKNVEPKNGQNFKNILRTYTRLRFIQNFIQFFMKKSLRISGAGYEICNTPDSKQYSYYVNQAYFHIASL